MDLPERDDPYQRLGVPRGAPLSEIKRAYRRAAQRWHPDRNPGNPDAHRQFLLVQSAFQKLSSGEPWEEDPPGDTEQAPPPDPPPSVQPRVHPHAVGAVREGVATVLLFVRLDRLGADTTHRIRVSVADHCPACRGLAVDCRRCSGTGQVMVRRKWDLVVPARTPDGTRLLGRGLGHRRPGVPLAGDVHVVVRWKDAGPWKWEDGKLVARLPISRHLCRRGGSLPLRMPDGRWTWFSFPPGVQPQDRFHWPALDWGGASVPAWLVIEPRLGLGLGGGRRAAPR